MKMHLAFISVLATATFLVGPGDVPLPAQATSLGGDGGDAGESSKDEIVTKYVDGCRKPAKEGNCDKLRKEAVEVLKEDLRTLGSSANRAYMPAIVTIFKGDEPELRIAAADAVGMIGPQDQDVDVLAPLTNDPVPDVRNAVMQMLQRGKGPALTLLSQRTVSTRRGLTPDTLPDARKLMVPVAPDSTYLFYASDVAFGRLSYTAKSMNDATAFFKAKAKKGPMKLDEFQEKYRDQLNDEQEARDQAQEEKAKQLENVKPDPTNTKSFMEFMEKVQSIQGDRTTMMLLDSYQPNLFGAPTVYVLEERQIGQRSYPTRYVVLYQDQALKRPGYRLSWMTLSDQAIKSAQKVSSHSQRQEEVKQEKEPSIVKEKSEQEKKKFKKGQSDLEKELGF